MTGTQGAVWELLRMVAALALVLPLAWWAARLYAARAAGGPAGRARRMQVVESLPLGPQRAIHLIRIGHRFLVVGSTARELVPLCELRERELSEPELQPADSGAGPEEA